MTVHPPSYRDTLKVSSVDPKALLLVRLEVWHYYDLGRSQDLNHQLAQLFIAQQPSNWTVREVEVVEPDNLANRDCFVPVQVEFENRRYTDDNPNGRAQYDVRRLFRHVAPALIFLFFLRIGSKPFVMSLVPRNVPELHHGRYAQIFAINKLNILTRRLVTPKGVGDIDALATVLSTLDNGLSAMSRIVELFHVYTLLREQNGTRFSFLNREEAKQVFNVGAIFRPLATIAHELRREYNYMMDQRRVTWANHEKELPGYEAEFSGILERLRRTKNDKAITPQGIYQTALDLHAVSLWFTRLGELVELDNATLSDAEWEWGLITSITTGVIILWLLFVISGEAVIGLLGLLGSAAVVLVISYLGTRTYRPLIVLEGNDPTKVRRFRQNLGEMVYALNWTRNDMTVMMIQRLFGIKIDQLGGHDKMAIWKDFAVDAIDAEALQDRGYHDDNIRSDMDIIDEYLSFLDRRRLWRLTSTR
ncbi:hypothetical protein GGR54DRAFT_605130 [Hypoxylon sp. NC1633]|nr:hypothetical protein GGR54DRAFT_605130 [Hypoxylon sp. NC1633]